MADIEREAASRRSRAVSQPTAGRTSVVLWRSEATWVRVQGGRWIFVEADDELVAAHHPDGVRFLDRVAG